MEEKVGDMLSVLVGDSPTIHASDRQMQQVVLAFELHPEVAEDRAIALTPTEQDRHSCPDVLDKRTQNPTNFRVLSAQ